MEIFNVSSALWKAQTLFIKLVYRSLIERSTAENASFYTKLLCQKPGEIESGVQNGYITKNGVLAVTTLFFGKFCFSLWISYKELIWYTNQPNIDIYTFEKHWGFIWECFFPVSILKILSYGYYHWRWNCVL